MRDLAQSEGRIMKTDALLKQDIDAELDWDPAINPAHVGVAVTEGVVTLTGHVTSYPQKWAIQKAVRRVSGVKAIALDVEVCIAPIHRRDDTDIAAAAMTALEWHTELPPDAISVTVEKGWITLQGEVDWDYQRRSAERIVRGLQGVVGLCNDITLRKKVVAADIAERIRQALARRVEREARGVTVQVDDNVVTLRGSVHTWQERDATRGAAASAAGVSEVVDELTIG
jgi:osmotically-inducible protein OsmY